MLNAYVRFNLDASLIPSQIFAGQLNVAPDPEELLLDKIMLSLRQSDGLDISSISEDFGQQHASKILKAAQPHIQAGLVLQSNNGIRLRDPEGFLLSNTIISDLFAALDWQDLAFMLSVMGP